MARLGDPHLIHRSSQVPAFLGLTPCEDSTGDDTRRGRITKAGDGRLRNKLIQASWIAIRREPELAAFFKSVYDRNTKNHAAGKAITAVANKLGRRLGAMLKNQTPYRSPLAAPKKRRAAPALRAELARVKAPMVSTA